MIFNQINYLKNSEQTYDETYIVTEGKVDLLKSKNESVIDSILKNKVDYSYRSLIAQWEKVSNNKNKIEKYINNSSKQYSNVELLQPQTFEELIKNLSLNKQLIKDIDQFNQKLDGEVLPILQQANINLN